MSTHSWLEIICYSPWFDSLLYFILVRPTGAGQTSKGVNPSLITAEGKGEENPVMECKKFKRAALIKCLEPNRRVEVEQIMVERRVN